jgi:hypothetical protein
LPEALWAIFVQPSAPLSDFFIKLFIKKLNSREKKGRCFDIFMLKEDKHQHTKYLEMNKSKNNTKFKPMISEIRKIFLLILILYTAAE